MGVTKLCDEAEAWLKEETEKQDKAGLLVKPPSSATEYTQYIKGLANEIHRLRYKPKPKPKYKPKPKNVSNDTNTTNASEAGSEEEKKEEKKEEKPKNSAPDEL